MLWNLARYLYMKHFCPLGWVIQTLHPSALASLWNTEPTVKSLLWEPWLKVYLKKKDIKYAQSMQQKREFIFFLFFCIPRLRWRCSRVIWANPPFGVHGHSQPWFHIVTGSTSIPSSKPPYKTLTAAGDEIKKAAGANFGCVRTCVRICELAATPGRRDTPRLGRAV